MILHDYESCTALIFCEFSLYLILSGLWRPPRHPKIRCQGYFWYITDKYVGFLVFFLSNLVTWRRAPRWDFVDFPIVDSQLPQKTPGDPQNTLKSFVKDTFGILEVNMFGFLVFLSILYTSRRVPLWDFVNFSYICLSVASGDPWNTPKFFVKDTFGILEVNMLGF